MRVWNNTGRIIGVVDWIGLPHPVVLQWWTGTREDECIHDVLPKQREAGLAPKDVQSFLPLGVRANEQTGVARVHVLPFLACFAVAAFSD
jgi:hypothetical protein